MMEFWHCHKPDVPVGVKGAGEGGDNTTKGYGANTRMMAQRGVGKVDLTYFLLDSEDCSGLEVRIFVILFFAWFLWVLFVGHQEGGLPAHRFSGKVTDTNAPERSLHSVPGWRVYPLTPRMGYSTIRLLWF